MIITVVVVIAFTRVVILFHTANLAVMSIHVYMHARVFFFFPAVV